MLGINNDNPFEKTDKMIKLDFYKSYGLVLNNLNYNVFGIIDDVYLLSLIGESSTFNVYLGYSKGKFLSVKVLKFSKYFDNQQYKDRVNIFNKEILYREKLSSKPFFPQMFHINPSNFIIYEEFCDNGKLLYFAEFPMNEILIRTIFIKLIQAVEAMKDMRVSHNQLNLENILLDFNFEVKIIGVKEASTDVFFNFENSDYKEGSDVHHLGLMLCALLFKADYHKIKSVVDSNNSNNNNNQFNTSIIMSNTNSNTNTNTNNNDDYMFNNPDSLENVLRELINKHYNTLMISNQDSLLSLLINILNGWNINQVKNSKWVNTYDEILSPEEYFATMSQIRIKALQLYYEEMRVKEKELIIRKKGVFKVVK